MASFSCKCKNGCTLVAFVASLLIGVIAAFLRFSALITVTPAFLWAIFGIGVGFLLIGAMTPCYNRCADEGIDSPLSTLVYSALGTVLFSVILLAGSFVATSIAGAIFTGLAVFSFSFLLGSAACLIGTKCDG
jgi:hypothetical protein